MYFLDGVTTFFLAWVGPHGALELPAIVFGGAAGLRAGRALIAPGVRSQAAALRAAFPSVWRMMLATALVLVLAGLIEGSFSQFSARTFPYPLKIAVAALLFGGADVLAVPAPPARGAGTAMRDRLVLTPEHVEIRLQPAGLGSRFLAITIDVLLVAAITVRAGDRCSRSCRRAPWSCR